MTALTPTPVGVCGKHTAHGSLTQLTKLSTRNCWSRGWFNALCANCLQNFYNALGEFRLEVLQQTGVQDKHHPSLISEYASIEWLPEVPQAPPSKILQTPWPAGEMNEGGNDKSDNTEGNQLFKIVFYFSPEEYVRRAMRLEHPASQFHLVPDSLRMNIFLL